MRVTNHPIEPEELMAYLDGELPTAAAHVESCEECQRVADDFRNVSARLGTWQVEPSILEAPKLPEKPKKPSFFGQWRWVSASLVVSVVLFLVVYLPPQRNASLSQIHDQVKGVAVDRVSPVPPMIVRIAQLTITVEDVDKSRQSLDDIVKRHGGYLGQLSTQGRTLEAMLRVPTDQLEASMSELKQLGHVESESQNGEEVTQQYVDLDARLSNARNSEKRLTELLSQRTGKLSDVLEVEKEVERVRGEIEQMEAERKNLANRVDFATITVTLAEEHRAELPGFRNAAVVGYRTLVDSTTGVALFVLANGPTVLFWSAILFFPCRWVWRRSRRRLVNSL